MISVKIFLKSDLPGNANINVFFTEKSPLTLYSANYLGTQFFRQNKVRQRTERSHVAQSAVEVADRTVNYNFVFFKHFQTFVFC